MGEADAYLSQHCDCTHTHENRTESAVAVDTERVLKYVKIAVAELPRAIVDAVDTTILCDCDRLIAPLKVPLSQAPLISLGALRAPPVFA